MRTGTDPIKLSHLKAFLHLGSELLDCQPASCDLQMAGRKRFLRKIEKLHDDAFFFFHTSLFPMKIVLFCFLHTKNCVLAHGV